MSIGFKVSNKKQFKDIEHVEYNNRLLRLEEEKEGLNLIAPIDHPWQDKNYEQVNVQGHNYLIQK